MRKNLALIFILLLLGLAKCATIQSIFIPDYKSTVKRSYDPGEFQNCNKLHGEDLLRCFAGQNAEACQQLRESGATIEPTGDDVRISSTKVVRHYKICLVNKESKELKCLPPEEREEYDPTFLGALGDSIPWLSAGAVVGILGTLKALGKIGLALAPLFL